MSLKIDMDLLNVVKKEIDLRPSWMIVLIIKLCVKCWELQGLFPYSHWYDIVHFYLKLLWF